MRALKRFAADERAGVAVFGGIVLSVVLGAGAFAVDVGHLFTERRRVQSAADLAAIAAASDLTNAGRAAAATLRMNRMGEEALQRIDLGTYTPDPALAPEARFRTAAASTANAARVSLQSSAPVFLGRLLTGDERIEIRTSAVATRTAFASFAIGSGLATVEGGIPNQVLGSLLGTSLSLSAMDYRALASANLDMFRFADALATRMSITGGNYQSLLGASAKVGDIFAAMLDTGRATGSSSASALTALAQATRGLTMRVPLNSLLNFGPYAGLTLGQRPQVGLTASALDLASAAAQLANGTNQAAAALDVNLPGITAATLRVLVGERPRGTSWIIVGAEGSSVHTAQTRLLLTVTLAGSGSIAAVTLPIYLEIASAQARLTSIACGTAPRATIAVTPSVLDAWIGAVTPAMLSNFVTAPNPGPATLVDLPLVKIRGRAHATITNLSPTNLTFSQSEAARQIKKTVSTTDFTASLLSRLIADLDLDVTVLGLGIGIPGAAEALVSTIVAGAARPLDQLLSSVLASLGISLGQAHVWTTGIRCDGAVLVN